VATALTSSRDRRVPGRGSSTGRAIVYATDLARADVSGMLRGIRGGFTMARFRSLPLPALVVVLFVVTGALWFGIGVIVMPDDQPVLVRLIGTIFYAGAMTAVFGLMIVRARRLAGGVTDLAEMRAALKAGSIPPAVDPGRWVPTFEKWERQYRLNRWFGPVTFIAFTALTAWLALSEGPVWWPFAVFFVAAMIWSTVDSWRGFAKVTAMLGELRRRTPLPPRMDVPVSSEKE
jgi:hypothetical protein